MNSLKAIWTSFKGTVKGFDTSRQLAVGVACGLVIGLIPKDSLLPYAIALIAILSRGNLLSMGVSGLVFSGLSPALDSVSHRLGIWLLTLDPLQSTWSALYQLPVVPWTRLENSVVTGSLLLGLISCVPIYLISFQFFERFGTPLAQRLLRNRVAIWLIGRPAANPAPNPQES